MTAVLNPPPIRELTGAEHVRMRAQLDARIAAAGRPPRRIRPWRVAAACAAIAVAAIAVLTGIFGQRSRTIDPVLAAALRRVSAAALRQPDVGDLKPGQYLYLRYSYRTPVAGSVRSPTAAIHLIQPETLQWWVRADGSGRVRGATQRALFATRRDRGLWIAAGRPDLGMRPSRWDSLEGSATGTCSSRPSGRRHGIAYDPCGFGRPPRLPSDPAALYTALLLRAQAWAASNHVSASQIDAEIFAEVYGLIANPLASAGQRAAGYSIVGRIPGVRMLGRVRDPLGRVGLAIGYPSTGDQPAREFVFDPHTYRLLDQRESATSIPGTSAWEMWHGPIVVDGLFQTRANPPAG